MTRTAVHIYCCVRTRRAGGVERRGEAKTAITAPLWRGSAYHCHCCYFFVLFLSAIRTVPCRLWHSLFRVFSAVLPAVLLLYYSRTHIVASWVVGCFFVCCVLCCSTAVLRTAVVLLLYGVAGRIVSWVCPWVRGFFLL